MKKTTVSIILVFLLLIYTPTRSYAQVQAQHVSLQNGWKFKTGDSPDWSAPSLDDRDWKDIDVTHQWERQGYPAYDGLAWYRLRTTIPSSLRKTSFFKDSIRINLGYIDDGGEVYLNGRLVYKNWISGDIRSGLYGPGIVTIAANDPALLWDRPNVIAVRIFDSGGDGGIYGPGLSLRMASPMDNLVIDTDEPFVMHGTDSLSKKIALRTSNGQYRYNGKLQIKLVDPASGVVILTRIKPAIFTDKQPMVINLGFRVPAKKSYEVLLTYTDTRSSSALTIKQGTPYILTPPMSPKPKLNSAAIYGARPGRPFLYKIPATGTIPLIYQAAGLPNGLTLDGSTGIITGSVEQTGDYPVLLTVNNKFGSTKKIFTIRIGSSIGLTPAMGWNSWNAWGLSVNDSKVRVSARSLSDLLSAHGWAYINIDDGWEAPNRNGNGQIATNDKFPDMKATADYVHSLGLKFGIYSSPGPTTCGGYLGSWQHELQDARSYGTWGVDYLKYDLCSYRNLPDFKQTLDGLQKPYIVMRAALDSVPRDIIYSFCQYGMGDVWTWGATVGGNSWRTTGDITDSWESLSDIGFSQDPMAPFANPGHFNDPDMLIVGKVGWGSNQHDTHLTPDEQYTHISLWCLLSSPLLIGCDLGHVDNFTLNLLTNDEVLAIDQDSLGISARQIIKADSFQVWEKKLADGSIAVGFFNTATRYQAVPVDREKLGLTGYDRIRDLWRQQEISLSAVMDKIPPHGVRLLKFWKS
ncbi:MAG TPA: putative Ig domain-containing protein [Puia sp.]|nr:putative Ig domain-containing protein [Puia sp.]